MLIKVGLPYIFITERKWFISRYCLRGLYSIVVCAFYVTLYTYEGVNMLVKAFATRAPGPYKHTIIIKDIEARALWRGMNGDRHDRRGGFGIK